MATVRFPDGTEITASALSSRSEINLHRDFGLYMDPSWRPTWPADLIAWPDFGVPDHPHRAAEQIVDAFHRARCGQRVEIGCIGGKGRTGTVLACMAVLSGVPADAAVAWVRSHYHPEAVETSAQAAWVEWFATHVDPRTSRSSR